MKISPRRKPRTNNPYEKKDGIRGKKNIYNINQTHATYDKDISYFRHVLYTEESFELKKSPMHILGIYLDGPFLLLHRMRKKGKKIHSLWSKMVRINEDEGWLEEKSFLDLSVKQLYKKKFKGRLISAISSKDFLIRSIDFKVPPGKHREESLFFQIEAFSPFKSSEVLHLPLLEKGEKGRARGLLLSASKPNLQLHLDLLKNLNLDPDTTSCSASALCLFARYKFPEVKDFFILDLGFSEISCTMMKNGLLYKSHSIPYGVKHLLEALYEDRKRILLKKEIASAAKQMDLLILKAHLNPRLFERLELIKQELARVKHAFTEGAEVATLCTGRVDAFIHLKEILITSPLETPALPVEEAKFALPLGICLEEGSLHPVQLRKNEFSSSKSWVKMGKTAFFLFFLSFLCSASFFGFASWLKKTKEKQLYKIALSSSESFSLEKRSLQDQIDHWIENMEKKSSPPFFIKESPKVTAILHWLSTHPLLEEFKKQNDPIDLQLIRSKIEHLPTLESPEEIEQLQVEIEFSFKNVLHARRFHEFLSTKDPAVDRDKEIVWDVLENSYRAIFYLKNEALHVF